MVTNIDIYTQNLRKAVDGIETVFRSNIKLVKTLVNKIRALADEVVKKHGTDYKIKIMNFCGTHEWTTTHYGIRSIVPSSIELVAGPGCPVCVTPSYYIEEALKLALEGMVVYTYGDTYRLRTVKPVKGVRALSEARAYGALVKVVTSFAEAISDAKLHGKDSVFIGIGFETVAPGYARAILNGIVPRNLKLLSIAKLTPPAMTYTLEIHRHESPVKGVIAPGHVSTITGAKAWKRASEEFGVPVVISGFEPIDVLISVLEILRQLSKGVAQTVIEYTRAVTWDGDLIAQKMISDVFDVIDDAWRGIGFIPESGLRLKNKFKAYDAFHEFGVKDLSPGTWSYDLSPGCRCADIILGKALPTQCPLFMKVCTPSTPIGPCMVSIEGTCSIWAKFGSGLVLEVVKELNLIT